MSIRLSLWRIKARACLRSCPRGRGNNPKEAGQNLYVIGREEIAGTWSSGSLDSTSSDEPDDSNVEVVTS